VPIFEKMDEHILDAVCDRLKATLYTKDSYIVREGDPVDEMLFIMRGTLLSVTTNGGRTGFFNAVSLKAGDFCGEGLLTWALDPQSSNLPISTRTVQALSEVEAFALEAEDLKTVASQFRRLHHKDIQHTFRQVFRDRFSFLFFSCRHRERLVMEYFSCYHSRPDISRFSQNYATGTMDCCFPYKL
jgi:cyclic nucleotide gated channel